MTEKVYNFRGSSELLDKFENGRRSNFIRESIELNMRIEATSKNDKIIEINKLKSFYQEILEHYDTEIKKIEDNKKKLLMLKTDTEERLENTKKEENKIKTIYEIQKQKEYNDKLIQKRLNLLDQIIINILECRDDKEVTPINLDYMKTLGKYKNTTELRNDLTLHINNLTAYDNINNRIISRQDIEYLKNVNRSKKL